MIPQLTDLFDKLSVIWFTAFIRTNETLKAKGGFLVREIFQRFKNKTLGILNPDRSLWIYSAHDNTLVNTLSALNIFDVKLIIILFIWDSIRKCCLIDDNWFYYTTTIFYCFRDMGHHMRPVFIWNCINQDTIRSIMFKRFIAKIIQSICHPLKYHTVVYSVHCRNLTNYTPKSYQNHMKPMNLYVDCSCVVLDKK